MSTELNTGTQTEGSHRRHYVILGLGIIALATALYFGPELRDREPNYYDPARAALLNARQRFEESMVHEQELISHRQIAREELKSAITELARAANLDPADRARIEDLRSSLLSIESPDSPEQAGSQNLHQSYHALFEQMEALIADLEDRSRKTKKGSSNQ